MKLRIGTRRSRLALAQAEQVSKQLEEIGVGSELVPMVTSGDRGAAATSSPAGLKGLWIDTILQALRSGDIDLAVHSAKDLPAEDEEGIVIAAVPERADPFDLLITRDRAVLTPDGRPRPDSVIGTSSLRRRAQILDAFPDVRVVELRGNVDTRLRKLEERTVDVLVLAAAGLARLGIEPPNRRRLTLEEMVPAPGQGCLAIQARGDDEPTLRAVTSLDDHVSRVCLQTERELVRRLGGGCALPLGAYAQPRADLVLLHAVVATPDGSRVLRVRDTGGDEAEAAGRVERVLRRLGAGDILDAVRP